MLLTDIDNKLLYYCFFIDICDVAPRFMDNNHHNNNHNYYLKTLVLLNDRYQTFQHLFICRRTNSAYAKRTRVRVRACG